MKRTSGTMKTALATMVVVAFTSMAMADVGGRGAGVFPKVSAFIPLATSSDNTLKIVLEAPESPWPYPTHIDAASTLPATATAYDPKAPHKELTDKQVIWTWKAEVVNYTTNYVSDIPNWGWWPAPPTLPSKQPAMAFNPADSGQTKLSVTPALLGWYLVKITVTGEYTDPTDNKKYTGETSIQRTFAASTMRIIYPIGPRNPQVSWLTPNSKNPSSADCRHRFDYQGVSCLSLSHNGIYIEGEDLTAPPPFHWEIGPAMGAIEKPTVRIPTHKPPASAFLVGQWGVLGLLDSGSRVLDEKSIQIFTDHLARDMANFGTDRKCKGPWPIAANKNISEPSDWNCFGSTIHLVTGLLDGWAGDNKGSERIDVLLGYRGYAKVGDKRALQDDLGELRRGDVIVYFQVLGDPATNISVEEAEHAQVVVDSVTTYAANNEPINLGGKDADALGQTWKWATSKPGIFFNNWPKRNNFFIRVYRVAK